jgi:MFS family permease
MKTQTIIICMLGAQVLTLLGFASYAVTLNTLQVEWSLTNFQSGLIASIFFLGYMGVVSFASVLTDRLDARRIYLVGVSIEFVGLIGLAFFVNGFYSALLFMCLSGAGVAGTYMPGLKILTDRVKTGELTRYISFYTAFFGVGVGLSYFISGLILQLINWHYVFGVIALGPLLAGCIVFFCVKPLTDQKWHGKINLKWGDFFPFARWRLVLKNKDSSSYILGYVAHSLELFASRSWLVAFFMICSSYSVESFFLSGTEAASLINFFGVPASIIGNEIAIRIGRKKWVYIVMSVSAIFGIFLSMSIGQAWWLIMTLAIGHSIFIMADSATLTAGLVTSTSDHLKGAAMGLHSMLGFGGGFMGPSIFGFVLDLSGGQKQNYAWVWAYISIVIWGCLFVVYQLLSRRYSNKMSF